MTPAATPARNPGLGWLAGGGGLVSGRQGQSGGQDRVDAACGPITSQWIFRAYNYIDIYAPDLRT